NGTLRVIDVEDGQTCRSTETQLSWKDGITGKVANSDKLDGMDSSKFARAALFGSPVNARTGDRDRDGNCFLGEVGLFAGERVPSGWEKAQGQLLSITQNTALYSLLGTDYGGNGQTNFALPDLRGAEPKGAGPAAPNYAICTVGQFPQ
ncbi:phage tail protein, partial [Hyalangium sp.]|uniref:phage tail protein n=1 Tax=Hyalangium sp. TaxID=2028555 RepID=UPI002D3E0634